MICGISYDVYYKQYIMCGSLLYIIYSIFNKNQPEKRCFYFTNPQPYNHLVIVARNRFSFVVVDATVT